MAIYDCCGMDYNQKQKYHSSSPIYDPELYPCIEFYFTTDIWGPGL